MNYNFKSVSKQCLINFLFLNIFLILLMIFKITGYFVVKIISKRKLILIYDDTRKLEYVFSLILYFLQFRTFSPHMYDLYLWFSVIIYLPFKKKNCYNVFVIVSFQCIN
jgi:hypothetical protein